jgi:hypothetical protein
MKFIITVCAAGFVLFVFDHLEVSASSSATHRVMSTIAGVAVDTSVDSEIASQLLNNGGQHLPAAVSADLRGRLTCGSAIDFPDTQSLQEITRDYSPDTATALLIQCLATVPQLQKSQQLFLHELALRREADPEQATYLSTRAQEYMVLIVPGWGYQSNADVTGSDLAMPRNILTNLGFEHHLVALEDTGSVEEGARVLVTALHKHLQNSKRIILVSASSGGPTVALALADPSLATHPRLVGWLNICGILHGTPVIDDFMPWPKSLLLRAVALYEGWNYQGLLSLSRAHSQPRYAGFTAPARLTIVNYVGIPFSGQVSDLGQDTYDLLKTQGPNDGLTLISDALAPGYTIMAVGMDHFVNNDPEIDLKTAALLPTLLKLIEE